MKRCFPYVLALAIVSVTPIAMAAPVVVAKVTYAGTYGDGRLFVGLDTPINEPGCTVARFDVPSGHPQIKTWTA